MCLEVFPNSCFGIVARPPGPVRKHFLWHILDDGIEDDTIAALASEWRIGLQFCQHMIMRVVTIEADQHMGIVRSNGAYLFNDLGRDAGALNHLNT